MNTERSIPAHTKTDWVVDLAWYGALVALSARAVYELISFYS